MRLAILPDSIQNGSPHSWSHPAFFLSCCQMTNRSKPLGPNWTIPKELGGRKACPLQSCYFFLPFSLLSAEHRTSYSLFQVLRKLAALGWWMNALLLQKSLFYTARRRGRWIFYFRLCLLYIAVEHQNQIAFCFCPTTFSCRKQKYLSHSFDVGSLSVTKSPLCQHLMNIHF